MNRKERRAAGKRPSGKTAGTVRPALDRIFQLALQHHQAGRPAEAERLYREMLQHRPDDVRALHQLGLLAHEAGRSDSAIGYFDKVVALTPEDPIVHNNLGEAYRALCRAEEAIARYREALRLRPGFVEAHNNLGTALLGLGRSDEAAAHYREALRLRPNYAMAHYNLAGIDREAGRLEQAVARYREALRHRPDYASAHNNIAHALMSLGRLDEVMAHLGAALRLKPDYADAHNNLGIALQGQGRLDEAMVQFGEAVRCKPDHADAHWNRALIRLLRGEFAEGWEQYECRWQKPEMPPRGFAQPLWEGGGLAGRTILLHAEQGLGDTLQFIRYVPLVAARGGRVVLEIQGPLLRLAGQLPGVARFVAAGDPLPEFDCHLPLMSLPRVFGTTLATIPAAIPYLQADAALVPAWRERLALAAPDGGLRVGLVWAGRPTYSNDRNRSIGLPALRPLLGLAGVRWFSLQVGERAAELAALPEGTVTDLAPHLTDFAETAAAVSVLDLVITVDTAVAHLAGALGLPVWVLLPFLPDWRWLLDRDDSPWYPTVRLFRQPEPQAWQPVIGQVAEALAARAAGAAGAP